ncbi:MAG: type I DNA topoisomerase [Candidatus Magasanikbacteria bacterium]|nr:type I DNA topoisomerase [Candidatus Magasanikbacteria bacterium]
MSRLVIVESPTKAKTISKFLGKGYKVESSFGHIRDLPKSKTGVDVEHDFTPTYLIPADKKARVKELKALAQDSDEVLFATDEDREGEAISWHLAEVLGEKPEKIKRITFHEITKKAIEHAIEHPRKLDLHLVDAQQARRIVDRLVGYELSPFLWKKVRGGLSAGRVQSVAVRLIVEREREIQKFNPEEYWTVDAKMNAAGKDFESKLSQIDGAKLEKFSITTEAAAKKIEATLKAVKFTIADVEKKSATRQPAPPFTTSTLQQDANRRLGATAKMTMMFAQRLYEMGHITYMRTDSVNMNAEFQLEAVAFAKEKFGKEYSTGPRVYTSKSKNAQEAHEAIRPTDIRQTPEMLEASGVESKMVKMYDLIWRRALASQMSGAEFNQTGIDIAATGADKKTYTFRANGQIITFAGFLAVYTEAQKETLLPEVKVGDVVKTEEILGVQHFTEPPARYNDATLVKIMEEYGIGRPSTYAPTIATIIDRGYVEREERRLKPTEIAFTVTDMLVEHFPQITDYQFTAEMENQLDEIAEGNQKMAPVLHAFYDPFKKNLIEKIVSVKNQKPVDEPTDEICDKCGKPMVIKMGRFGRFMACSGYPTCKNAKPIHQTSDIKCPECGEGDIVPRKSKKGKVFYSCNRYPDCKNAYWDKPTGKLCPACNAMMVQPLRGEEKCSNKECPTNEGKTAAEKGAAGAGAKKGKRGGKFAKKKEETEAEMTGSFSEEEA